MRGCVFLLASWAMIAPNLALADPRCARFGEAGYSATRTTTLGQAAPMVAQVFLAGAALRVDAAGPGGGRLVTLITPELHAMFVTTANPAVAVRLVIPRATPMPPTEQRERAEPQPGRTLLITELRGASGQWHEVARTLCRRDGVLLEARQFQPGPEGPVILETRHTEIRTTPPDPALFRLPAGFRLIEAPPAPQLSRRTAPPPG